MRCTKPWQSLPRPAARLRDNSCIGQEWHARATLAGLGVEGILPEADCSCVLHAFRLPGGQGYEELHAGLKARGFVIYAGQGRLAADIFRISLMGDLTTEDLARLAQAFRELLTRD